MCSEALQGRHQRWNSLQAWLEQLSEGHAELAAIREGSGEKRERCTAGLEPGLLLAACSPAKVRPSRMERCM